MQWCSQAGYCGDTPDHKKYGTDCTGCINEGNYRRIKAKTAQKSLKLCLNITKVLFVKTMLVVIDSSVTSACPSSCKCASGLRKVDKNGNCNYWCSQYGACGDTNAHKQNGVDCRGCTGKERINV